MCGMNMRTQIRLYNFYTIYSYLKKLNHRDASWETVPNAFAELLERHSSCNAPNCLCPHQDKRTFQQES